MKRSIYKKLFSNSSGVAVSFILSLLTLPFLTRILSPALYADVNLVIQSAVMLSVLLAFRMDHLIVAAQRSAQHVAILNFIIFLLPVTAIFIFLGMTFLDSLTEIFQQQLYSWKIRNSLDLLVLIAVAVLLVVNQTIEQFLQTAKVFFLQAISEGFFKVGLLLASLVLVSFLNINDASYIILVALIIKFTWLCCIFIKFSGTRLKYQYSVEVVRNYWQRAMSLSAAHFAQGIYFITPLLFVKSNFSPISAGYFTLAFTTVNLMPTLIAKSIGQVFYQDSSQGMQSRERLNRNWKLSTSVSLLIMSPFFSVILLFNTDLYGLFFGSEFAETGEFAVYMLVPAILAGISRSVDSVNLILNYWWYSMTWHTLRSGGLVLTLMLVQPQTIQEFLLVYCSFVSIFFIIDIVAQYFMIKMSDAKTFGQ